MNENIKLLPVKDLDGLNFNIPDYQRGYRWDKQQATDLLEDIYAFSEKEGKGDKEIYCIQPLVVSNNTDETTLLDEIKKQENLDGVKKLLKGFGSWNVVDGQQRLTTIYLILRYFDKKTDPYTIEYQTRRDKNSTDFLKSISEDKANDTADDNIDYFHMYQVYDTIKKWFEEKSYEDQENFISALLNKVNFIWYQIENSDEIATFQRLNIGKIPLTDAELIKALFLNKKNFGDNKDADKTIHEIALEWDEIERTLQNDEFWLFLHGKEYNKPTRIDFILDMICESECKKDKELEKRIGNDEHKTFRYFYEDFKDNFKKQHEENKDGAGEWLSILWGKIKHIFEVFEEWYHDYKMYHYIGYLTEIDKTESIYNHVVEWDGGTKDKFVKYLKDKIKEKVFDEKYKWINAGLFDYVFDDEDSSTSKRNCVNILLLHNIETIIQQNEQLVKDTKYNLPNFSKFPFHLYKSEKWQVEHIRPNAGDNLTNEKAQKIFLALAKKYLKLNTDLSDEIDKFLKAESEKKGFDFLYEKVIDFKQNNGKKTKALDGDDKNRIFNFVLLDEKTNKEYGNQIFPVKRAFIANKEKGVKIKYTYENNELKKSKPEREIAFVPPCTKNVFAKFYTDMPSDMLYWTEDDAKEYAIDMYEKLRYYLDKVCDFEKPYYFPKDGGEDK